MGGHPPFLALVIAATLYFWPFIGAALRARKLTSQRLTGAVDALDQRAAGFLPAPQGQPARAFEPDFEVDPYANTLEFAPVDDEPVARERWAAKAPPRRYMDKLDPMPQAQHDEDFGGGLPLVDDGTW